MATSGTQDELRARAATMRAVAKKLDGARALDLARRAGPDVWIGPTPQRCVDALTQLRSTIIRAASELRTAASVLERRALHLDLVPIRIPG